MAALMAGRGGGGKVADDHETVRLQYKLSSGDRDLNRPHVLSRSEPVVQVSPACGGRRRGGCG